MESIENKMSAGSKDKVNFFTHVFEFNETNKDLMLNMVQYGFLTIIPLVLVLKVIKNWFPEEDSLKGSVTILVEVIGQLLFIYAAIWFIHKTITFIPTYSGKHYEEMNFTTILLPFMFLILTMQTKLGAKINILTSRIGKRIGFKQMEGMDEGEEDKKKQHQNSQSDYLDTNTVMPNVGTRQVPDFNQMYGGPATPMVDAASPGGQPNGPPPVQMAAPEPMAANGVLGGGFGGSSW